MQDQASQLRKLVSQDDDCVSSKTKSPQRIVLLGAKGGVGTTTIAINLAIALRKLDHSVMLIDAAKRGGDVATICDVSAERGLEDVLQSRCDWNAATITGPTGISLVVQRQDSIADEQQTKQLKRKLDSGLARNDFVVIDAGAQVQCCETIVRQTDLCLILSSPDHVSMKRSYRLLRQLWQTDGVSPRLVINGVRDSSVAHDMAGRLTTSTKRLLGFDLETFLVNADPLLATNLQVNRSALCVNADALVSQQLMRLSEQLTRREIKKTDSESHRTASQNHQQTPLKSLTVA